MGFYMRKSFGKGPFKVTVSKRGISTSVGVKGTRIGYYTSFKSNKRAKNKNYTSSKSNKRVKNKNEVINSTGDTTTFCRKILAWMCRILFVPMVILGLLLSIIQPTIGIVSIIVGIIEFTYSHRYFKKAKDFKKIVPPLDNTK